MDPKALGPDMSGVAAAAVMTEALGRLSFPISKGEAVRRVHGWEIPLGDEASIPLGDLLEALPEETLHNYAVTAKAIDRNWSRVARTLSAVDAAETASRMTRPARR